MSLDKTSAYFVLGMHRSGTSAVSGALRFLGGQHGDKLMEDAPDNPKGFWESRGYHMLGDPWREQRYA